MHSLATSYQPVRVNENDDDTDYANGSPKPSRSRFADYLPTAPDMFGGLKLESGKPWWHTFTTTVFGWPMPPHDPSRETVWLDGLRGTAAFLVMSYHFNLNWYSPGLVEEPWGANMAEHGWDLWRMPFLRLWMCSGHTQVSIFFVLSGFVLSWSPLGSINAANYDKLYRGLGSSAFRRWIRLYLPTLPIAFWECLELYFGWREKAGSKERVSDNFFVQLWDFFKSCEQYANPFDVNRNQWSSLHAYDYTMWTIPFEFAGSLLVFMILLAVGRIRNYHRRTLAISLVVAYCAFRAEWSFWLFSNGILIADYVRYHGGFQSLSEKQTAKSLLVWSGVLIFALWLGGTPAANVQVYTRPGYDFLDSLTPNNWVEIEGGGRLWWNIAGILIVFAISHLSAIRHLFEFSALRYLGRISYMLYLTHRVVLEPALHGFREWLLPRFGRVEYIDMPPDNSSPYHWMVTIALYLTLWAVIGPTAIFTAHWCERLIDAPSVRFAKWLDEKFMKKSGDSRTEDAAPTLPIYTNGRPGGGAAAPVASYRDDEPAQARVDAEELKENLELTELPPRSEANGSVRSPTGQPQQRSLV